jgi:hypothetical protein
MSDGSEALPGAEKDAATCGATDWAPCDDGTPHVYGICNQGPGNHWHREMHDGRLWAEWSTDCGPVPPGPWCEHTRNLPPGGSDA